jgi:hypothetical protein
MITLQILKHIDALVSAEASHGEVDSEKVYEADEVNVCLASLRRLKPSTYQKLLGPKLTVIGTKVYNGDEVDTTPGLRISFACARVQLTNVEKKIIQLRDAFRDTSIRVTVSRISAAFAPDCDCIALQDEFVFFDTRAFNGNCRILVADDNIVELADEMIANWLRFACEQVDTSLSLGTPKDDAANCNNTDSALDATEGDIATASVSPIHVIEAGARHVDMATTGSAQAPEVVNDDTKHKEQMQESIATDTDNAREAVAIDTHQLTGKPNVKRHKNKFYL